MEDNIVLDVPSTEEVAQHYSAMLDSVTLLDSMRNNPPLDMDTEEVTDCIARNVEHLELMVAKDFWTVEDMTTVNNAIAG